MSFHVPEKYRVVSGAGRLNSSEEDGNNGLFFVPVPGPQGRFYYPPLRLRVIASDGLGWDHVSVSLPDRCPLWMHMVYIKKLFWDPEDCVVQFHPPQSLYVNCHPYTLHLWRHQTTSIVLPDPLLVGPK